MQMHSGIKEDGTGTVLIDDSIDEITAVALVSLLKEHYEKYKIDLDRVAIKEETKHEKCPKCKHDCPAYIYPVYSGGRTLLTHKTCDCGYTYISNIYGIIFMWADGEKSRVWDSKNYETVTEEHALRIIESKLVTFSGGIQNG